MQEDFEQNNPEDLEDFTPDQPTDSGGSSLSDKGRNLKDKAKKTKDKAKSAGKKTGGKTAEKTGEKVAEKGAETAASGAVGAATGGVGGAAVKAASAVSDAAEKAGISKGKQILLGCIIALIPLVIFLTMAIGMYSYFSEGAEGTGTSQSPSSSLSAFIERAKYYAAHPQEYADKYPDIDPTDCAVFVGNVLKETIEPNLSSEYYQDMSTFLTNSPNWEIFNTESNTNNLQPGDILYKSVEDPYGHVAIYIGDGQVVDASLGNHLPQISPYWGRLDKGGRYNK